jgi:hypothetical protein
MRREGTGRRTGARAVARSWRGLWCVPVLALVLSAGCTGDLPGRGSSDQDDGWVELDTAEANPLAGGGALDVGWRTIAEQTQASRSTVPVEFSTTSDVLRIITRLGNLESPTEAGLVLANLLSRSGSVPVATVRVEQIRQDSATVDTVEVQVDPGPLQLYVVEAHGVADWSVRVQAPLSAPLAVPTRR